MFSTGCAGGTVCLSRSLEGETLCWRRTACDSCDSGVMGITFSMIMT